MATMRIHFTEADIARTRVCLNVDPMWEIVSSVQLLQHQDGDPCLRIWRERVRQRALGDSRLRAALLMLVELAPHAEYFPDFLTPAEDITDLRSGIDAILTTPHRRIRSELALLPVPAPRLTGLADGTATAMRDLRSALTIYHQSAIQPDLDDIQTAIRTDSAHRAQTYLRHGAEAALSQLAPFATWTRPVLSFGYPVDRDLHLAGRGLVLIPSYFCLRHPVALADPSLRPTLVHPITTATRLLTAKARRGDHTSALLGHTRAAILRATFKPSTTSTLAYRIGVTAATISHHTTVLRESGLITTHRNGGAATHTITPLGLALVAHTA